MKNIIIALCILLPLLSKAQLTREQARAMAYHTPTSEELRKAHPNANRFYKSAADYYADKPVEGIDWKPFSYSYTLGTEKIEVIKNGNGEKIKFSDLPTDWVTDENGLLLRRYDGKLYSVVVDGPLSYYVQYRYGYVNKSGDGSMSFGLSSPEEKFFDYYSETLNGEIKKWDDKVLEQYMTTYNLTEKYKNDKPKREMKDSVDGFKSKMVNRDVKYIKLVNEQLAKK